MFGEAHAHLFMNGYDYRKAVETHKGHIEETVLRGYLEEYRNTGSITGHRPLRSIRMAVMAPLWEKALIR